MNENLLFYIKKKKIDNSITNFSFFSKNFNFIPLKKLISKKSKFFLKKSFLRRSLTFTKKFKFFKKKRKLYLFFFLNRFLLSFLETFFKSKILIHLKKGTNKLFLKQVSLRKFNIKYFKKHLRVRKQIIGILYYTFLLKDVTIFINFFKYTIERLNLKLHKKVFLGLRKLIKDLFKPLFNFLGLLGVFFNIKGKIGVSGSSKKRRYFFHFGNHSITKRALKVDLKHIPLWTPTGSLGFKFLVFF